VGKKVKVVFDTNVWISIFLQRILNEEYSRVKDYIIIYVSSDILLEISKVLLYPKIADILNKAQVKNKDILRAIEASSILIEPKTKLNIIKEDPEDNKILECAVTAEAKFIVTGDKHLLGLGKFKKTRVLTPREFFDLIT